MSFRLVPKSVTLNDLEWQNGPYFSLFFSVARMTLKGEIALIFRYFYRIW